jgi:putative oxidoreductase
MFYAQEVDRSCFSGVFNTVPEAVFTYDPRREPLMKIAILIARILLGLIFFVFGLNGFFHFIPMKPSDMPTGEAGQFVSALIQSHYFLAVAAVQVIGGALLLAGRYVPLGLVLLGPVIVNILLYHALLFSKGIGMALVVAVLWFVVAYSRRENLAGIFAR